MKTRRTVLALLGTTAIAGCAGQTTDQPSANETADEPATSSTSETKRTGIEIYFDWIHGENGSIRSKAQEEISLEAVDQALEGGIEQGRDQAIANALETASQQYDNSESYEDRHRTILSATHQAIQQKTGSEWDFNIFSNINYTQTVGDTLQYSEIKVETGETEDGHKEYSIINAALSPGMNHATHTPGEDGGDEVDYKRTMEEVRHSSVDAVLPPHDTEAIQARIDRGAAESWFPGYAELMGYQLFAGGHSTDDGAEYRPDQMLVPANQETHETIDEIGYEQGDRKGEDSNPLGTHGRMDLQLAINEHYFNEGYDETDNPVVIDNLQETEEGWDFELYEEENWTWEEGYPAQN